MKFIPLQAFLDADTNRAGNATPEEVEWAAAQLDALNPGEPGSNALDRTDVEADHGHLTADRDKPNSHKQYRHIDD